MRLESLRHRASAQQESDSHCCMPAIPAVVVLQEYIASKLQPTLVKALTVLARQKPTSNKLDAITFLANWMLENNPNKPQVQVPPELQQQLEQQQQAKAAAAVAAAAAAAARQAAASSSKAQCSAGGSAVPEVGIFSKDESPCKHCEQQQAS